MKQGKDVSVCVIGAGPSGITAVKHLIQVGITNIVCYDKNDQVGGNWIYSPDPSHSSVYETAHIISSKKLSQYHDFKMPEEYPDYPNHKLLLKYFQDYADHFGVTKYIQFKTEVQKAELQADESWIVTLKDGTGKSFDYLLVASGHHWNPSMPSIPGTFTGEIMHSHYYKSHLPYKGKKVLVIGAGNSACDISVDISRHAAFTAISWRRGYYVFPKIVFGQPGDVFASKTMFLPLRIRRILYRITYKLTVGNNAKYGLPKPDHKVLSSHPILNSQFLNHLRHCDIHPRKDVKEFNGKMVTFTDGTQEEYDNIIMGTGYKISIPYIQYDSLNYENKNEVDLYLKIFHPDFKTLGIIGLFQPQGCIWPASDTQAQIVANYIVGNYKWPKNIKKEIQKEVDENRKKFIGTYRHLTEVEYHSFQKRLDKQVPKKAPVWNTSMS